MPTDRRTRAGSTSSVEPATDAWVIVAGTSTSDSTPPSDSASVKRRVASAIAIARSAAGRTARPRLRHERDHPAAGPHLAALADERGARMGVRSVREARVEDAVDVVAPGQEPGDGRGVRDVPLDPDVERPQAAQDEEAVERAGDPAHRVLEEAEPLGDRVVAGDRDPEDRVRVAAEVLRRGVEHDVGAERERVLERRRGERVVDDEERAARRRSGPPARGSSRAAAAMSVSLRFGFDGRLEPDEPGPRR